MDTEVAAIELIVLVHLLMRRSFPFLNLSATLDIVEAFRVVGFGKRLKDPMSDISGSPRDRDFKLVMTRLPPIHDLITNPMFHSPD